MHTTLTLYTATQTITVPRTREATQTSLSSFGEDFGGNENRVIEEEEEEEEEEVVDDDECDPAACAGCKAWYLCRVDLGAGW